MKILYGICGIGNGHIFRQLPILTHLLGQGAEVLVFGYQASLRYFRYMAKQYPNLSVLPVAVPYYPGKEDGLDFALTAQLQLNEQDFLRVNCQAMDNAQRTMGSPDLVISDYEPVSAQYAYAYGTPLVTIDQQSKYLVGDFPSQLEGTSYADELMRLRMLFPQASQRIACSFFQVPRREEVLEQVTVVPPVIRRNLLSMKRRPRDKVILVYLSVQQCDAQPLQDLHRLFTRQKDCQFHVFLPHAAQGEANVRYYVHGDGDFDQLLAYCSGIISTAGHGLLSEAMQLGIPVLALPISLYEQQMNAHVIASNGFGMSVQGLDAGSLRNFVRQLPDFAQAIVEDRTVLFRRDGLDEILSLVNEEVHDLTADQGVLCEL